MRFVEGLQQPADCLWIVYWNRSFAVVSPHAAGQLLSDTKNSNPKMTPIWHRKMKFYRLLKPFPAWAKGADYWRRSVLPPHQAPSPDRLPAPPAPTFPLHPKRGKTQSGLEVPEVRRLRRASTKILSRTKPESLRTLLLLSSFKETAKLGVREIHEVLKCSSSSVKHVSWWLK